MTKKKVNYLKFKIPIPIYRMAVWVVITDDYSLLQKHLDRTYGKGAFEVSENIAYKGGLTYSMTGVFYTIWIRTAAATPRNIAFIAHELTHICQYAMHQIGAPSSQDNNEPSAYLMDYLMEFFMKKILKK